MNRGPSETVEGKGRSRASMEAAMGEAAAFEGTLFGMRFEDAAGRYTCSSR